MKLILYFRPPTCYNPEKLSGVMDIATKARVNVHVIDEPAVGARVRELTDFWHCQGVIIESGSRNEKIDLDALNSIPTIFFNHDREALPEHCFAVSHDSRSTGRLAAKELLHSNFHNFAFIPAFANPFWSQERELGFIEALELNDRKPHVFHWPKNLRDNLKKSSLLQRFLKNLPKPCAVFAANDTTAAEIISSARLLDIAIPEQLAVLGVDDSVELCEHTRPTLSSIKPNFRRGGNLAMLMLLAVMRDGPDYRGARHLTFDDLNVVRRLSTKPLHRSDPVVRDALDLIRRKACNGLTAAEVVKIFPCSRRMTDLRFTRAVGHTILDEIQEVRLDRAEQMLLNPNQALKAIADFCGFKHPNSLRKFFLKKNGVTMSEWRRLHQVYI